MKGGVISQVMKNICIIICLIFLAAAFIDCTALQKPETIFQQIAGYQSVANMLLCSIVFAILAIVFNK